MKPRLFGKRKGLYVDPVVIRVKARPPKLLFEGRVIDSRPKAILVQNDHYQVRGWVPRCALKVVDGSLGSDADVGDEGKVYVAQWFIERLREGFGRTHRELPPEDS